MDILELVKSVIASDSILYIVGVAVAGVVGIVYYIIKKKARGKK